MPEELALFGSYWYSSDRRDYHGDDGTAHSFGFDPIPGELALSEGSEPITQTADQPLKRELTRDSLLSVKPVN